jgi:hypothetical protein
MIGYCEKRKSRAVDDGFEESLLLPSFLSWFLDLSKQLRSRRAALQSMKDHAVNYGDLLELGLAQRTSELGRQKEPWICLDAHEIRMVKTE